MRVWPRPEPLAPAAAPSGTTVGGGLPQEQSIDGEEPPACAPSAGAPAAGLGGAGGWGQLARGGAAGGAGAAAPPAGLMERSREHAAALALIARRTSEAGSSRGSAGAARPRAGPGAAARRGPSSNAARRPVRDTPDGAGGGAPWDAASEDGGAGGVGGGDLPGTLGARLADLGRQLLHNIDSEFDERRAAAAERLGACYVMAAEAAAAAGGGSVGGSFVSFPSMSGAGGLSGAGGGGAGSLAGGGGAGSGGAAGDKGGITARKLGALKGAPGAKSRRVPG